MLDEHLAGHKSFPQHFEGLSPLPSGFQCCYWWVCSFSDFPVFSMSLGFPLWRSWRALIYPWYLVNPNRLGLFKTYAGHNEPLHPTHLCPSVSPFWDSCSWIWSFLSSPSNFLFCFVLLSFLFSICHLILLFRFPNFFSYYWFGLSSLRVWFNGLSEELGFTLTFFSCFLNHFFSCQILFSLFQSVFPLEVFL